MKSKNIDDIIKELIKQDRFLDANWLITKYNTEEQNIQFALYAVRRLLHIFKLQFYKTKTIHKIPYQIIIIIQLCVYNPTKENKNKLVDYVENSYNLFDILREHQRNCTGGECAYAAYALNVFRAVICAAEATLSYFSNDRNVAQWSYEATYYAHYASYAKQTPVATFIKLKTLKFGLNLQKFNKI